MTLQLEPVAFDIEEEYRLFIGGEWVSTSDHYEIIDPNTTELVGHAPEASTQQANDAAAAKMALRSWKTTPMAQRCALLAKAADLAVAFDEEDEAVEIASHRDYGLFAYVNWPAV